MSTIEMTATMILSAAEADAFERMVYGTTIRRYVAACAKAERRSRIARPKRTRHGRQHRTAR